jgi:N-methylhydantoinase A/oxoprolinase/acetone carboxylase beta subunit
MLTDYIAIDPDGNVVGKYQVSSTPDVPDGFSVNEVDDIGDYQIEESVKWFP